MADEDALTRLHLADRNLLWWLACATGVFACCRFITPEALEYCPRTVERAACSLQRALPSLPGVTPALVAARFPYAHILWISFLVSLVRMPWWLWQWGQAAEDIAVFVQERTDYDTDVGDVCRCTPGLAIGPSERADTPVHTPPTPSAAQEAKRGHPNQSTHSVLDALRFASPYSSVLDHRASLL
jgi:hypothetical protein